MTLEPNRSLTLAALSILATLMLAAAAFAGPPESDSDSEESIILRDAIRLEDCPDLQVLGTGPGLRMVSLSPRAFLGVEASEMTPELRAHFGAPEDAGVMLSKIVDDSAAQVAGLAVGDIVTRVDADEIASVGGLGRASYAIVRGNYIETR